MSSDDAKEFRKKQVYNVQRRGRDVERRGNNSTRGNIIEFPERYTAQRGSASRAKEKSKKRVKKMKLRIASLLLAAGIGIGGISVIGSLRKEPENTITQLQEKGIDINQIGLESDTLQMMKKYDEYFAKFDQDKGQNLTDNDVIGMIDEIRVLNENAIGDKIGSLRGVEREDVKINSRFDNADGTTHTSVKINEDEHGKEESYYNVNDLLFEIGKKNSIPDEVAQLIVQLDEYEDLIMDLKNDKITKVNAVKKIEELYKNISKVVTKEFNIDEKGNITTKEYNSKENQKENKANIER